MRKAATAKCNVSTALFFFFAGWKSLKTSNLLTSETSRHNSILKVGNNIYTAYWYAHVLYRRGGTREKKVRKAAPYVNSYTGTHTTDTMIAINPGMKAGLRDKFRSRDPSNIEAILTTRPGRTVINIPLQRQQTRTSVYSF